MTSGEAIIRLRTYLDEAQAGFYTDSELFNALSDGLKEIVSLLYSMYRAKKNVNPYEALPEVLKQYLVSISNGGIYNPHFQLPNNFMFPVSVLYSVNGGNANLKPCYERESSEGSEFLKTNTFMASSSQAPYYSIGSGYIDFESPITGTGAIKISYIRKPESVTQYTEIDIPEVAHNAMVQFAYSVILRKDLRTQESLAEYQTFLGMLSKLYM